MSDLKTNKNSTATKQARADQAFEDNPSGPLGFSLLFLLLQLLQAGKSDQATIGMRKNFKLTLNTEPIGLPKSRNIIVDFLTSQQP